MKTIFFKVPEGVQHFTGAGIQIFPVGGGGGGGGANVKIKLVNFQGGRGSGPLDPRMRMIDPLASSVKPIPKDRFSHAMAHFSLLERLVALQNMIRYMILDILSDGSTLYFIWNKHALIRKLWEAEKNAPILYIYICIDLSLSVTCVFEGSLNDVIMAQHAKG